MDETNFSFCPHCGARVPPDAAFCNECGTALNGYVPPSVSNTPASDPLSTPMLMTFIYGILISSLGVLSLVMGLSLTPEVWEELIKMVPDYEVFYPGVSASSLQGLFLMSGAFIFIGGVVALVTYVLMKKRIKHTYTVAMCAVTSILSIGAFGFPFGLLSLAIGLYVTYQIYKNKSLFSS